MKVLIFKTMIPLLLLLGFVMPTYANNVDHGGKTEFTKKIERDFEIDANGKVGLSNKHGKIEVKTWNKNSVDIEITITVNARSESNAEDVFDRINIDFDNGSDFVKAMTVIESKNNSWWTSGSGNKSDFEINYLVHMPSSCVLQLSNKYGHSFVEDIRANVIADIKYGDLTMAKIGGNLELQIGYGNGVIDESANASIDLKYGSLRLKDAGNVTIDSKYSNVFFNDVGDIDCTSKYDTYTMGNVGRFKSEGKYDNFEFESAEAIEIASKYTNVKVGTLKDAAYLGLQYGGVKINEVAAGFSTIEMVGKHTDFKVGIEDGASYRMDLSATHGSVKYPEGIEIVSEKRMSHTHQVKAYKGSENSKSIIKLITSYGNCKIY